MELGKLFSLSYLFQVYPGEFRYMAVLVTLFLILILGSFYLEAWIKKHPQRKSIQHLLPGISARLRLLGLVGFVFLWIRYENLPYLSMRALFLLFLIYTGVVMGRAVYRFKTHLPTTIEKHTKKKTTTSYLPKKKKR